MPDSGRASQGRYPALLLAIFVFLCWHVVAAPAAAQDVVVNSADPPAAEQGTVNLDVVIGGSGFKKGAVARFLLSGSENPGGITVNSTTFKGPGQLIANIHVADNASLSKFDIEVINTSGRRGKGIELFSVTEGDGGTTGTVALDAQFRDALGTAEPIPDRIVSDCSGGVVHPTPACPYQDGANGVDVSVSGNDNFGLYLNTGPSDLGTRDLIVNFSDCVSPSQQCTPPFVEGAVGTTLGKFVKLVVFRTGDLAPGDLAVDQSGMFNAQLLISGVTDPADGETEAWFITFRPPDNPNHACTGSGSGPLVVRHPEPDTWEIEATTGNLACLLSQVNNKKVNAPGTDFVEFHGTYVMPFLLRLERKP